MRTNKTHLLIDMTSQVILFVIKPNYFTLVSYIKTFMYHSNIVIFLTFKDNVLMFF